MSVLSIVKSPLTAFARIWRRRRQAQEWKHKRREFVYLDETSVISLVAARHGAVPESFKDTVSTTNSSDVGTSLTVPSTPAGPGTGMSTRSASSRTTSQEVVRRAVAQGTFRSLRIGDTDLRISVEDQPDRPKPAAVANAAELARHLPKLEKQHRAVRSQDLLRGDVIEVQVELSPEWSYQLTTAVSSMIDLVDGRAGILGIEESALGEGQGVLEVLSRLLVDLVPLQSRVTSHRLVMVDEVAWIVDASMIASGSELDLAASEIHLAGVTELPLYWKDVRRVLFAGAVYSVYARLSSPGVQASWSPVKLADVFDRFLPGIGDQIRELPYLFEKGKSVAEQVDAPVVSEVFRDYGLVPFGRDLAQLTARKFSADLLWEVATDAAKSVATAGELQDVGIVRSAFEKVVAAVKAFPSLTDVSEPPRIERDLVRALRETHQSVARLTLHNQLDLTAEPKHEDENVSTNYLEAEIVAIYW